MDKCFYEETKLRECLTTDYLKQVAARFHFPVDEFGGIEEAARRMAERMEGQEGFWYQFFDNTGSAGRQGDDFPDAYLPCMEVVMSLGAGVDELQEEYTQKGLLFESYIIEVLGSDLLIKGYELFNDWVAANSKWHVAGYLFFGSVEALPLERIRSVLKRLRADAVTCNAGYCLQPKKSVIFLAELTQDADVTCRGICVGCNRKNCINAVQSPFS